MSLWDPLNKTPASKAPASSGGIWGSLAKPVDNSATESLPKAPENTAKNGLWGGLSPTPAPVVPKLSTGPATNFTPQPDGSILSPIQFKTSTPNRTTESDPVKNIVSFLNPKNAGVDNPLSIYDVAREYPGVVKKGADWLTDPNVETKIVPYGYTDESAKNLPPIKGSRLVVGTAKILGELPKQVLQAIPRAMATVYNEFKNSGHESTTTLPSTMAKLVGEEKYKNVNADIKARIDRGDGIFASYLGAISQKTMDVAFGAQIAAAGLRTLGNVLARPGADAQIEAWKTLGSPQTEAELKANYRDLSKQFHPDVTGGDDTAIKVLNKANQLLDGNLPSTLDTVRNGAAKVSELLGRESTIWGDMLKPDLAMKPQNGAPLPFTALPGQKVQEGQAPAFGLSTQRVEDVGKAPTIKVGGKELSLEQVHSAEGTKIFKSLSPEEQVKFSNFDMEQSRALAYKGESDLTTSVLKDLEGKTTVSKQYILDATNRPGLKQVEREIIRNAVEQFPDTVPVASFAQAVKAELLPLTTKEMKINEAGSGRGLSQSRYENISLPSNLRGEIKDYKENLYQSPIPTSAGEIHFGSTGGSKAPNYFGHTRVEDMGDSSTRRVIEVQSDLYQKGRLEEEINASKGKQSLVEKGLVDPNDPKFQSQKGIEKLQQYNDPTAHFRMVREEVKKAVDDMKHNLQFPTGETAMKIEGLGVSSNWVTDGARHLTPDLLKVGREVGHVGDIMNGEEGGEWIITDVLGDGKFKAVPKDWYGKEDLYVIRNRADGDIETTFKTKEEADEFVYGKPEFAVDQGVSRHTESFDISGKVDASNPIYKFYEKDLGRYLKNKYGAQLVTDGKGVTWWNVALKNSHGGAVEAFKMAPRNIVRDIIGRFTGKKMHPHDVATAKDFIDFFDGSMRNLSPIAELNLTQDAFRIAEKYGGVKGSKIKTTKSLANFLEELTKGKSGKYSLGNKISGTKASIEEVRKAIYDIIPKEEVRLSFKDDLIDGVAEGRYSKSDMNGYKSVLKPMIELYSEDGLASLDTAYHEAGHYVLDNFMTKAEKADFIAEARKELGPMRDLGYKLSGYNRSADQRAEEYLMDQYAKAKIKGGAYDPKHKTFFDKLDSILKKIIDNYHKVIDHVKKLLKESGQGGYIKNPLAGDEPKPRKMGEVSIGGKKFDITKGGKMDLPVERKPSYDGEYVEHAPGKPEQRRESGFNKYFEANNKLDGPIGPGPTPPKKVPADFTPDMEHRQTEIELKKEELQNSPFNNKENRFLVDREKRVRELGDIKSPRLIKKMEDMMAESGVKDPAEYSRGVENFMTKKEELKNLEADLKTNLEPKMEREAVYAKPPFPSKEVKPEPLKFSAEGIPMSTRAMEARLGIHQERVRKAMDAGMEKTREAAILNAKRQKIIEEANKYSNPETEGLIRSIKHALSPLSSVDNETKTILRKWNSKRVAGSEMANIEAKKLAQFKDAGMMHVYEFEAGKFIPGSRTIKTVFDELRLEANKRGGSVGIHSEYLPNYLPHVYKGSRRENMNAILEYLVSSKGLSNQEALDYVNEIKNLPEDVAKRLKLVPHFTKERIFPDYLTAQEYGLKPKYDNVSDLAGYYRQEMEKSISNRELIKELEDSGKIIPDVSAPTTWSTVNSQFSGRTTYKAPPPLAKILNNMFRDEEMLGPLPKIVGGIAKISKFAQEMALSAGFPKSSVNFYTIGQTIKEMTAGNFKSVGALIRSNSDAATAKYFEKHKDTLLEMAKQGIQITNRIGKFGDVTFSKLVHDKDFKEAIGVGFDKLFNEKTFQSFMPMLQTQLFEDVMNSAFKKGMTTLQAKKLAGDTVKMNFGLNSDDFARGKTTNDAMSAVFFAPKFRESVLGSLYNTGKAGAELVKYLLSGGKKALSPELGQNRKLLAGMILTFIGYNILNKKLNGNYMWQNPKGKEFALRIPFGEGDAVYLEFMPSYLSTARNLGSGLIATGRGDFSTAEQKFGSLFSMPLRVSSEIITNRDYFDRPIYKDTDSLAVKGEKIALYTGLAVNHPYIKELINQIQNKNPLYQSIVYALEFPLKFSTDDKEKASAAYDALDKAQNEATAKRNEFRGTYDKITEMWSSGKSEEAGAAWKALTPEEQKMFKSISSSEKAKKTRDAQVKIVDEVQEVMKLLKSGDKESAGKVWAGLTPEEQKAFTAVYKKLNP